MAFVKIQQYKMAEQAMRNIINLYKNIRSNAIGYKEQVVRGDPTADVIAVLQANNNLYLDRINWLRNIYQNPGRQANLVAGLTMLGLDVQELIDEVQSMRTVCNQVAAATITTNAHINAASDAYLAAIPQLDSVWPE